MPLSMQMAYALKRGPICNGLTLLSHKKCVILPPVDRKSGVNRCLIYKCSNVIVKLTRI